MKPPTIIETDRLFLRQPIIEDVEAIFERYAQDLEVTKYLTWKPHQSIAQTQNYINSCILAWTDNSSFPYVLVRKKDNQLIGMAHIRLEKYKMNLGYVLARSEWGKGYTPEAVQAIVDWGLKQEDIYRIWAVCDLENYASVRVLEKVGMQREGILKRWIIHPNVAEEPRDCYCYAIAISLCFRNNSFARSTRCCSTYL
jgi:RimJ/RimL family protein N-acetyltransferase